MKIYNIFLMIIALAFGTVLPVAAEESAPETTAQQETVQAKVNINTASADELANGLKGVGKKKAELIVEYREKYGAFGTVEELADVKGIGKGILQANANKLAVE